MINISCYINGKLNNSKIDENQTVLQFLREELKMTGSREGCNEGDCGACTVLWGRKINGKINYQAVNSCLLPAVRLQNSHLVTIEGLKTDFDLHPIQQAFLDYNGAQCGFCTPGFIISIFSLLLDYPQFTLDQMQTYLEGNLCRCTGYDAIVNAVSSLKGISRSELLPAYFDIVDSKLLAMNSIAQSTIYYRPQNLKTALDLLDKFPEATLLAGNTDLQPSANFYRRENKITIDLIDLQELQEIKTDGDRLIIGASATLNSIAENSFVRKYFNSLQQTVGRMASNQIRNTATVGGNIINASPVADTVPLLLAANATLVLAGKDGTREVKLSDFYHGYKHTERHKNEILILIIIPAQSSELSFVKASKRKSVDISSLSSACALVKEDNKIISIRIGVGGGGPTPLLLTETAEFLIDKYITEKTVHEAAIIAADEITPISDVRGSADFRKTLLANHLLIHLGLSKND